jgi:integron integrase
VIKRHKTGINLAKKLIDIIKEKLEYKKYTFKTQKNYRWWIKKYILFHHKKHPLDMGKAEIESFLKHLSIDKKLGATTQNQALNAIVFLYEEVLDIKIKTQNIKNLRVKRKECIPIVLSKDELAQLFYHMNGIYKLMATFMYGCGLRMSELLNLRIKDIDFKENQVYVDGRVMPLPLKIAEDLSIHVREVKKMHNDDLLQGYSYLYEENSSREFMMQYLFPMSKITLDKKNNGMVRLPICDKTLGRNIKQASMKAKIEKKVSANTLRHTYATHMLQSGIDVKTLQELLGHKEKSTTMIYVHTLRELSKNTLSSPLDF